ncbi:MAG: hypothetical protein KKF48_01455 [Nanoarchaeota archaeon]|nr:hypothetical protein [Nanoarchaeota archaeon]MBU1027688.1 hypothetical protein [Nanoarchaeota archaeon]
MGRGQLAKATTVELQKKIAFAEKKKKELISYFQNLNQKYTQRQIPYSRYIEILHKKTNGKTIKQWVDFYNSYIKKCKQLLKKQKTKIIQNKITTILFSFVLLGLFVLALYYVDLKYTGFIVEEEVAEKQPEAPVEQPEPKQEDPPEEIIEEEIPENIQLELEEEVPIEPEEDLTPSQEPEEIEEPLPEPETNITIPEENITKEIEEEKEIEINITEEEPEINITIPPEENITKPIENITIPETNITIPRNNTTINATEIENASVETIQYQAVLGQPVKWTKKISLEDPKAIKIKLPKNAQNISIKKLTKIYSEQNTGVSSAEEDLTPSPAQPSLDELPSEELGTEEAPSSKITGENISTTNSEKIEELQKQLEELQEQLREVSEQLEEVSTLIKETQEEDITSRSLITGAVISSSKTQPTGNFITRFFKRILGALTGRAILTEEQPDAIEITIDENATEYEIEYKTPGPISFEEITPNGKIITISDPNELGYTNILASTQLLKETPKQAIHLYHIINGSKEPVQIQTFDNNSNELIDYIEWIVPHLSNQTYELEIIILNIQSYPTVGGNWTVEFTTIGQADLTITIINGTTWSNENEENELKFLEIKCGPDKLDYEWINNSIFISNYSCENQMGFEISKVLTQGKHHLEFDFGGVKAYAHNDAYVILGETGEINISNFEWHLIKFKNTYSSPPIVIASPVTENEDGTGDDENQIIPTISMINTTHFNITLCQDAGAATCDPTFIEETVHYFVFDRDADLPSWIAIGNGTVDSTDNAATTLTFGKTFSNAPLVWVQSQSYTQTENNMAVRNWVYSITTTQAIFKSCFHQGTGDACTSGMPNENIGWVAIDVANVNFSEQVNFQSGSVSVNGPTWGAITWTASYTTPRLMVSMNGNSGGQDPKSPWARDVNTATPDVRQCEQDGANDCDSHNSNPAAWFTMEQGNITLGTGIVEDITPPDLSILYPATNATNSSNNQLNVNYTTSDSGTGIESCWWSNDSYSVNTSLANCSTNITGVTWSEGIHSVTIWSNDTAGNENSSSITFTIDTVAPNITITFPTNNTNWTDTLLNINYTAGADSISCWYSNDTYLINKTIACGTNITTLIWPEGRHNVTIWNNDSAGNINATSVKFIIDLTAPSLAIVYPLNNTHYTKNTTDVNYTISDNLGLAHCWWSNDTFLKNFSINCGQNITTIIWANDQHNFTLWANDSAGNEKRTAINFTITGDSAPEIQQVYNNTEVMKTLATTFNSAPLATTVIINFSVYDANGVSDLNGSTANISFIRGSEETRFNSTCTRFEDNGENSANFTCNVTMWWWDASGSWGIKAYIRDNNTNEATNTSTNFSIASITGFEIGPVNLSWIVSPNSINQTSENDPIIINNTGNKQSGYITGNISINASNLRGETYLTEAIYAENFSVALSSGGTFPNLDECAGSFMSNFTLVNVTGAILPKGNFTKNDGTAQEELYFCINAISDISTQAYSTEGKGVWTIRILLVAISFRRKKKKIKNKIIGEPTVPGTIFINKLGALEALTKYLKEKLNLPYSEIAKLLNRDQRTIWASYNKSKQKQKATLKIKKSNIFIPISIFKNRKLTILESLTIYLRKQDLNYGEIAKILNRDQRNIWTIYSKAMKKINKIN